MDDAQLLSNAKLLRRSLQRFQWPVGPCRRELLVRRAEDNLSIKAPVREQALPERVAHPDESLDRLYRVL